MNHYYEIEKAYELYRQGSKEHAEILEMFKNIEDKTVADTSNGARNLIHLAAKFADSVALEYLISEDVKAAVTDEYGRTAFHALAENGRIYDSYNDDEIYKCTEILLKNKASTMRKDESGKNAYHVAAQFGVYPMIKAMLDNGVKMNMTTKEGMTALHCATEYVRHTTSSVYYNDLSMKKIKAAGEENKVNYDGRLTHEHTFKENMYLSKRMEHYFLTAKVLMEHGLDPLEKDICNKTPLDYSVESKHAKLSVLLKGEYDENDPALQLKIDAAGQTVHQACEKNDIKALTALLKLNADPNEESSADRYEKYHAQTPLAVACEFVKTECIELLLKNGANPNLKNSKGDNALVSFYNSRNIMHEHDKQKTAVKILKLFIDAGFEIDSPINDNADTALNYICKNHVSYNISENTAEELVGMGCDVNKANLEGTTPLMNICMNGDERSAENMAILLIENGAELCTTNKLGNTPLICTAIHHRQATGKSLAQLLFEVGDPCPHKVNNEGKSALEIATEKNNEPLVKLLLENL